MFESPTVFVIGAGASCELGFPSGHKLKKIISEKLEIKFEWRDQISGDAAITAALRTYVEKTDFIDINPYLHMAWIVRDGLPLANSIDTYLDTHQHDEKIILCGKLGIITSILEAERTSSLYYDPRNEEFNISQSDNTWLHPFFRMLVGDIPKSKISEIGKNITIVNFNYDRSLEYFLHHAFKVYYACDAQLSNQIFNQLNIVHPYGTIGKLPWMKGACCEAEYGESLEARKLLQLTDQIKIYTEQINDQTLLDSITSSLITTKNIVFLGFGFHKQNIKLLSPEAPVPPENIFCSTLGISLSDQKIIKNALNKVFHADDNLITFEMDHCTCSELLKDYSRSMTA